MKALTKLKAYAELLRVHNLVGTALGVLAGALAYGSLAPTPLLLAIFSACSVAAAGYAINDYFDIEIDKVNKPERPIPSGRVSPKEALLTSYLLFVLGVAVAIPIGPVTVSFAALNAILMYYYSKVLKKKGLIGNLTVAFSTSATLFYGALAISEWNDSLTNLWRIIPLVAMVFTLTLAREIVKGVEDVVGDSLAGVRTLAVIRGTSYALKVALVLTLVALLFGILSCFTLNLGTVFLAFTIIGALLSVYSIVKALRSEDHVKASAFSRRAMKIAMFLGLLGILLDRGTSSLWAHDIVNKL